MSLNFARGHASVWSALRLGKSSLDKVHILQQQCQQQQQPPAASTSSSSHAGCCWFTGTRVPAAAVPLALAFALGLCFPLRVIAPPFVLAHHAVFFQQITDALAVGVLP